MYRLIVLLALCLAMSCLPAWAQSAEGAQAAPSPQNALELAAAYQSGYLQVVAVSCFQLYSSTGIIQTDLESGIISPATALTALEHNSLLHSVCMTTLSDIRELTPVTDTVGITELDRLLALLTAEGDLLRALQDFCLSQTEATYTAVCRAQEQVEEALTEYAGDNPVGLKSAPNTGG